MARAILSAVLLAVTTACSVPGTVAALQGHSPPPEFGRPGWVRGCAGTGAWLGGVVGGVVSVVLLPVTWPISVVAGDSLGDTSRQEFLLFPATGLAATGHFLFGAPPDLLDFTFRRAWSGESEPENTYELVPMAAPAATPAAPAAGAAAGAAPAAGGGPAGAPGTTSPGR